MCSTETVRDFLDFCALGCVNSPSPAARGIQEAGFTQPRDHLLADPWIARYLLTEGEVSDPDEVGGEWKLSEAVGGREQVPPRDDDGAAPVEARVLAAHAHRGLPGVRAGAVIGGMDGTSFKPEGNGPLDERATGL